MNGDQTMKFYITIDWMTFNYQASRYKKKRNGFFVMVLSKQNPEMFVRTPDVDYWLSLYISLREHFFDTYQKCYKNN